MSQNKIVMRIKPSASDSEANSYGIANLVYAMSKCLEKRSLENDDKHINWHIVDTVEGLHSRATKALEEKKWVDAANLIMMIYNLDKGAVEK